MAAAGRAAGRRPLRCALSLLLLAVGPTGAAALLGGWFVYTDVDHRLVRHFGGKRWALPSKVYSDSYAVRPGLRVSRSAFLVRLDRLGYRQVTGKPASRGQYRKTTSPDGNSAIEIFLHAFQYPDRREPGRLLRLELDKAGRIVRIVRLADGGQSAGFLLEPGLITGLHSEVREERREMAMDEIPLPLVRAVIAVEDRRYFEHRGIDPKGVLRALVVNLRAGSVRQGGSTLTQQLMKNFFLTDERTVTRKFKEAVMALVAERRFSKSEILENYMNEIYLGRRGSVAIHGMWEASVYYFGKEPRELSMGEIATLAGIIRAPNYYSPHHHPERARLRRDTVLDLLYRRSEIDAVTHREARSERFVTVAPVIPAGSAPYFIDLVRAELVESFPGSVLASEGYTILTSLDPELQAAAERAVGRGLATLERAHPRLTEGGEHVRVEGALVALDPHTGAVRALVGGRDYASTQFNRAAAAHRQPGSVFKPIVMLAALGNDPAAEEHFLPTSVVPDAQFDWQYDGRHWSPRNYADRYYGSVTVAEGLERSLNSAVAYIAREVGVEAIRDLAVRMGMASTMPAYPAISLGGWEASPVEIARAYSVFASGGRALEATTVTHVVDRTGVVVAGRRTEAEPVVSEAEAYLVTHLLAGVMDRGTGRLARRLGFTRPAAGKTGTSNDFNDAWFAGFTPDLLAVVWVGFDKGRSLGLSGAEAALPIWTRFMAEALAGAPSVGFELPAGVVVAEVDRRNGLLAGRACRDAVPEAFLAGEEPVRDCPLHGAPAELQ